MIKRSRENFIDLPACMSNAYIINENNQMEIDYFDGTAYPNDFANIVTTDEDEDIENVDENESISSSEDESNENSSDSDFDWK